jgi:hypothetical protein
MKEWEELIRGAIKRLLAAYRDMIEPTYPQTPLPRPRKFHLVDGGTWSTEHHHRIALENGSAVWLENNQAAKELLGICGYQPRKVLRLLRRIQAATAWCEARRKGRERLAQEILRQQKKALEILEAESTIRKLAQ